MAIRNHYQRAVIHLHSGFQIGNRFCGHFMRRTAPSDATLFDDASRGPWGLLAIL